MHLDVCECTNKGKGVSTHMGVCVYVHMRISAHASVADRFHTGVCMSMNMCTYAPPCAYASGYVCTYVCASIGERVHIGVSACA